MEADELKKILTLTNKPGPPHEAYEGGVLHNIMYASSGEIRSVDASALEQGNAHGLHVAGAVVGILASIRRRAYFTRLAFLPRVFHRCEDVWCVVNFT